MKKIRRSFPTECLQQFFRGREDPVREEKEGKERQTCYDKVSWELSFNPDIAWVIVMRGRKSNTGKAQ
jgi:hypothetical protein